MLKFTFWECKTTREKLLDTVYQKELFLGWVKATVMSFEFTMKMCRRLERNQPDAAKGPQVKSTMTEVWTAHGFQSSGLRHIFGGSWAALRSVSARKAWRRGAPCRRGALQAAHQGARGEAGAGACEGGSGRRGERICKAEQNHAHGKWRCHIMLHVGWCDGIRKCKLKKQPLQVKWGLGRTMKDQILAERGSEWNTSLEMKKNYIVLIKKKTYWTPLNGVDSWMCFLLVQYSRLLWVNFLHIEREEREGIYIPLSIIKWGAQWRGWVLIFQ